MTAPNDSGTAAFAELLERHAHVLQKIARAYCPFEALRADLLQEMTIALWRSFPRYDAARPFATWMYRVALNVAISFYRSESRYSQRRAPLESEESADAPSPDPRVERLLECIDALDPLDKALVIMHLDGYSHAEIAGVLGITPTNTATRLARLKERLRRAMTAKKEEHAL